MIDSWLWGFHKNKDTLLRGKVNLYEERRCITLIKQGILSCLSSRTIFYVSLTCLLSVYNLLCAAGGTHSDHRSPTRTTYEVTAVSTKWDVIMGWRLRWTITNHCHPLHKKYHRQHDYYQGLLLIHIIRPQAIPYTENWLSKNFVNSS